ncbi:hypothetical protein FRC07_010181, partial [Ceratobasidium sp. 392]
AFNVVPVGTEPANPAYPSLQSYTNESVEWGERPWYQRRGPLADQVIWENPGVIGFQEVLWNQIGDLAALLGEGWDWTGVCRNDGTRQGEAVPIFWRKDVASLKSVEHFWLSDTPDKPGSIGWDAGQTRMATLAEFRTVNSSLPFYVFNTHYDERGLQSRTESSKLILKHVDDLIAKALSTSNSPPLVFLVGDLNSPDTEDGYRTLTGWRYVSSKEGSHAPQLRGGITFLDARHELHTRVGGVNFAQLLGARYGDWLATFTGFGEHDHRNVIDVVLVADTGAVGAPHGGKRIGTEEGGQKVIKSSTQLLALRLARRSQLPGQFLRAASSSANVTAATAPQPARHGHLPGDPSSAITTQMHFFNSVLESNSIPTYRVLDGNGEVIEGAEVLEIDRAFARRIYENMMLLPALDTVLYNVQRQGKISFYMTSYGEEASIIGSAAALSDTDEVLGQYREMGVLLWRNFGINRVMAQCFGNEEDRSTKGRQMPVHFSSPDHHFHTISSPLATQIPQAAGVAYALKRDPARRGKDVAVCYFGEGASSEGDFHAGATGCSLSRNTHT